jgi:hypothetical protein
MSPTIQPLDIPKSSSYLLDKHWLLLAFPWMAEKPGYHFTPFVLGSYLAFCIFH